VIMSDLAWSCYNSFSAVFPDVHWLWCVSHCWLVWQKKLKAKMPTFLSADDNAKVKRLLLRAVLTIIVDRTLDQTAFELHCAEVLGLMLSAGYTVLHAEFAEFMTNRNMWAPYLRIHLNTAVFGAHDFLWYVLCLSFT
jgi:hypothetical protein